MADTNGKPEQIVYIVVDQKDSTNPAVETLVDNFKSKEFAINTSDRTRGTWGVKVVTPTDFLTVEARLGRDAALFPSSNKTSSFEHVTAIKKAQTNRTAVFGVRLEPTALNQPGSTYRIFPDNGTSLTASNVSIVAQKISDEVHKKMIEYKISHEAEMARQETLARKEGEDKKKRLNVDKGTVNIMLLYPNKINPDHVFASKKAIENTPFNSTSDGRALEPMITHTLLDRTTVPVWGEDLAKQQVVVLLNDSYQLDFNEEAMAALAQIRAEHGERFVLIKASGEKLGGRDVFEIKRLVNSALKEAEERQKAEREGDNFASEKNEGVAQRR